MTIMQKVKKFYRQILLNVLLLSHRKSHSEELKLEIIQFVQNIIYINICRKIVILKYDKKL